MRGGGTGAFSPCGRRWPSAARSDEGSCDIDGEDLCDPSPDRTRTTAAPPCAISLSRKGRGGGLSIEGYASLWGVADLNGDVVARGAFADSLARTGPQGVRMLHQHEARAVVGVWDEMVEDDRGLRVRGRIEDWSAEARFAGALSRAGALDGLSIGFRTAKARRDRRLRVLSAVELWEVSLVTFPMLPGARFRAVD